MPRIPQQMNPNRKVKKVNLDYILLFALGLCIGAIFTNSLLPAESAIPPTRAFSKITMAGQTINASSYSDNFEIVVQGALTASINNNVLTIKLKQASCPALETVIGVDTNGNWVCGLI